jgi:hypothetical protein
MNTKTRLLIPSAAVLILAFSLQPLAFIHASPLGTAFTYQGRLSSGTNGATGLFDFSFALYNAASGGTQQGSTLTGTAVPVTNGCFTVTLDFGSQFGGSALWVDISVRTNGAATWSTLAPRQQLTPTPYSLFAPNAGTAANLSGSLDASQIGSGTVSLTRLPSAVVTNNATGLTLAGTFSGNGAGFTNVWLLGGNAGTSPGANYLGTSDNQPLELMVNGTCGFRLQPGWYGIWSPNVIGSAVANSVDVMNWGATIGGGGGNTIQTNAHWSTIAGGGNNQVQGFLDDGAEFAFIGGGQDNTVEPSSSCSTIAGGLDNTVRYGSDQSVIAGGFDNSIGTNASYGAIGGGALNTIGRDASYATIPGGCNNFVAGSFAFAAGRGAYVDHQGSFVWGDSQATTTMSTANDQFLVRAAGGVGINTNNPRTALHVNGTITATNLMSSFLRVDPSDANTGTLTPGILFGAGLTGEGIASQRSVGTGWAGLDFYTASQRRMSIANNGNVGIGTVSPESALQVNGTVTATAFSGSGSGLTGLDASQLSSGTLPLPRLPSAVVTNNATSVSLTGVFSGPLRLGDSDLYLRGGSDVNHGLGWYGPGKPFAGFPLEGPALYGNESGVLGTMAGGTNIALYWNSSSDVVLNPEGLDNGSGGPALRFGWSSGEWITSKRGAGTNQYGLDFYTGASRRLSIANNGNVGIGTSSPQAALDVNGTVVATGLGVGITTPEATLDVRAQTGRQASAGRWADLSGSAGGYGLFGGNMYQEYSPVAFKYSQTHPTIGAMGFAVNYPSWNQASVVTSGTTNSTGGQSFTPTAIATFTSSGNVGIGTNTPNQKLVVLGNIYATGTITPNSDRNQKTDFAPADTAAVLLEVARLPIQQWRFKAEDTSVKHLGPMAQDFNAAFRLGANPTAIATVDADGVALAAIQGLNQKLEEALKRKDAENAELRRRLEKLEEVLATINEGEQ